jgi:hypothetical protein
VTKEEKMRTKFAIALAIVAVCVTAAWAGWNVEFQVTDNNLENWTGWTSAHKVVIGAVGDVDGVVHMAWYVGGDVYYKRYFPGSGWSGELIVGNGAGLIPFPGIALDANGKDIHVVWQSNRTSGTGKKKVSDKTVYYRKCVVTGPGNGGWDEGPTDLCVTAAPDYYRWKPDIACGASGQVVVAWYETHYDGSPLPYSIRLREYFNSEWLEEKVIVGPDEHLYSPASIAANGDGDVFVTYTRSILESQQVFATRRTGHDGDWTDPEEITPGGDGFAYGVVEVSPEYGHPHILCWSRWIGGVKDYNVYQTYLNDQGDWEDLEVISDPAVEYVWHPKMFFTADGAAHVVWLLRDPDMVSLAIMYASCPGEGEEWTTPVEVVTNDADGVNQPDIAGGTDGTLFAVWQRKSTRADTIITKKKVEIVEVPDYQIWGTYNTPGGDGGSAKPMALSQSCFELFPNPAKAVRVAVQYSLPHAGQMTVTLVDISGRVVRRSAFDVRSSGMGSFTLDVSGLSAGVYMARLEAGDLDVSQALVIAR